MESKFTTFFLLTRSLLLLIPLAFSGLPFCVYFIELDGFEKEPRLIPAIIAVTIVFPFVFITIKNYAFVKIRLTGASIELLDIIRRKKFVYPHSDVDRVDLKAYKIEGATSGFGVWGSNRLDVNYEEKTIVYFKDGFVFIIGADTYSNYKELYKYIIERSADLTPNTL